MLRGILGDYHTTAPIETFTASQSSGAARRIYRPIGHIYAVPEGFQLCYFAEWDGEGPHIEDYNRAKRYLTFCRLSQDGTGEGIFFLERMPDKAEAEAIRNVFEIPRRKHFTEGHLASMTERVRGLRNVSKNGRSVDIDAQVTLPVGAHTHT